VKSVHWSGLLADMSGAASDPCFAHPHSLLSVEAAVATLLDHAHPLDDSERVPLNNAAGRILARDLLSPRDVPGFDNSAMDGYALHSQDMEIARTRGLVISQRIPAGVQGKPLQPGAAARIFTGAPVPEGADTVVMQESCRIEGERVFVGEVAGAGTNIRPRGNDITTGSPLLTAGTPMRAAQLGLAAAVGIAEVEVRRRLRVAVFSTGDELVDTGQPLAPGQIYDCNRYLLNALVEALGCEVLDLGSIADSLEATRAMLSTAAARADLVITSGGVSVGEEDHVKAALQSLGELALWRVRMKPGKPLAFGRIGAVPFIGLPGNPVSVFVTFLLFARPYLQRLQGRSDTPPASWPVSAGFDHRAGERREYLRVRIHADSVRGPTAEKYPRQGSDVLSSVVWADGLVEIPENTRIHPGDTLRYLPFPEWAR
jgi:molybdopterin molybdotransferase